jgi:hypothetical protein
MRTVEQILDIVCEFLNKNSINYVIVGGFAVLFYGNPRTTMDIDYVIQLADENIPELIQFLQHNGFHADEYDMRTAFKERSHCTVEDKETLFRLDIKGVYSEMDERALRNKRMVKLDGSSVWIASPEDTIVNKLFFAREQDIKDALGIFVRQYDSLDKDYLEETAKKIGVYDELRELSKKYAKGIDQYHSRL